METDQFQFNTSAKSENENKVVLLTGNKTDSKCILGKKWDVVANEFAVPLVLLLSSSSLLHVSASQHAHLYRPVYKSLSHLANIIYSVYCACLILCF